MSFVFVLLWIWVSQGTATLTHSLLMKSLTCNPFYTFTTKASLDFDITATAGEGGGGGGDVSSHHHVSAFKHHFSTSRTRNKVKNCLGPRLIDFLLVWPLTLFHLSSFKRVPEKVPLEYVGDMTEVPSTQLIIQANWPVWEFSTVLEGIFMCSEKPLIMCSILSLRSYLNIAFETVPMFIWWCPSLVPSRRSSASSVWDGCTKWPHRGQTN